MVPGLAGSILGMQGDPQAHGTPPGPIKPTKTPKIDFSPGGGRGPVVALATRVGTATHDVDSQVGDPSSDDDVDAVLKSLCTPLLRWWFPLSRAMAYEPARSFADALQI